jgi:predicted nucleic acid-binding protein
VINQAVTNSTCLIALLHIGQLDLLPRPFSTIMVPHVVLEEVGEPIPFLTVRSPANRAAVAALMTQLDQGEAEAIALAIELGSLPVILDDKKARRVAQQIGLRVMGTIGVLLRA